MTTPDTDYLRLAMFNGSVVATDMLKVSPLGSGFMFGEGLFETVRVRNSRPMSFDAHHTRLAASAGSFGAAPISSPGELHDRSSQVITANSLVNGSLKIVVFKEATGWSELILARASIYPPEAYEKGFHLKTVAGELRGDPLHALKSLNYLRNVRAKRAALASGYDEAVFIDPHRQVLEGATTSVFVVKNRVVWTPPLSHGILPGVMRARVLQILEPSCVCECAVSLTDLLDADEVFVTNALLGIMPVARVDETTYDLDGNVITRSLRGRFD